MKILITGAASGIGFNLAVELAKKNHQVFITTHDDKQLKSVKEKIENYNLLIVPLKLDITKENDRNTILKINPDVLINHAGIGNGGSLLDISIDVLRDNYETNIFASFALLKKYYNFKKKRGEKAKIFVTSSLASMLPIPYLSCYTSSKAAISMLVLTLYEELKVRDDNISITLIEPGAYHTGFNQVMIDNKNKFISVDNEIYEKLDSINKIQRNMFLLIEKNNFTLLIKKIVKEIEKEKPKKIIREPFLQSIFAKLYYLFVA